VNKISKGKLGELIAIKFLKKKGYKIIKTNYKTKQGEIDIIAEHGNFIIFIEVKYRTSNYFGMPHEAVNKQKQAKITKLIDYYYLVKKPKLSPKFEVVTVLGEKGSEEVRHYTDIIL
jgi:putative endonuclease